MTVPTTIANDQSPAPDAALLDRIRTWGGELGFQAVGFTGIELSQHQDYLAKWLAAGYHGQMDWMARHGDKRSRPEALVPGTCTVITARMDYLPEGEDPETVLASADKAYISRYALGRDYHKLMRARLAKLAKHIETQLGRGQYRAFVDSAPVLERALAENAGLGWIGKNTMLLNDKAGSWFFLGEIYTDIPLPADSAARDRALRKLPRLPRYLPDRCLYRALGARRSQVHFLPDDRARRRDSRSAAARNGQPNLWL